MPALPSNSIRSKSLFFRERDRYQGNIISQPAHVGVDDSVYGSLEVYRQEIRDERTDWAELHGKAALQQVIEMLMACDPDDSLRETLQSIIN